MSNRQQSRTTTPPVAPLLSQWQVARQLDQIGRPPTPFRISQTSIEILHIITALGIHAKSTPSVTRLAITPPLWRSRLEPWIKALLATSLAAEGTGSYPINMHAFRADALRLIPGFLNAMVRASIPITPVDSSNEAYALTPQLQHLFAKAWLEMLREGHSAIDEWTILLVHLNQYSPNGLVDEHVLPFFRQEDTFSIVRHIASVTPCLDSMSPHDLSGFVGFLCLFAHIAPKSRASLSQASEPCHCQGAVGAPAILSQLLTKLLRMKHDDGTGRRLDTSVNKPASLSAIFVLTLALDGPGSVSQALASGLFSTFLKRPHRIAALPAEPQKAMCVLLKVISRFMIYPKVLHELSRVVRKGEQNHDSDMSPASLLWDCWKNCLQKAAYLYAVRQNLKERGALYRCSVAAVEPSSSCC
ncbi:hypothetical protein AAF712_008520 [Marasmius tenuissimus]|uniref:Uncharacterized protein n=1 Tax=Marasmius tenuissimus TaxID=585030 RepID=A0ABR2ZSC0_9AGAR